MTGTSQSSPEYDRFRQTFFEECAEMLADMEGKTERLGERELDRDELDAIFRAVHSIKAGAGAFNYTVLVKFSHNFEALLDRMRDGRMAVTPAVASLIVRGGDVLSELVAAARENRSVADDFGADVDDEMRQLLDDAGGQSATLTAPPSGAISDTTLKVFHIMFTPKPELFRNANEPLRLIRELKTLGKLSVSCDTSRLPSLETMDIDNAYFGWFFELETTKRADEIAEVFEFVKDDCALEIFDVAQAAIDKANGYSIWREKVRPPETGSSSIQGTDDLRKSTATPADGGNAASKSVGLSSIRVELSRVDRLVNMVGELVIAQAMLKQEIAQCDLGGHGQPGLQSQEALETLTRELQECVMAIRMQPVKSVFTRMPRLVREVSSKLGKDVKLHMSGEHTELDKTVIEELTDPLTHMIRNSIDHGIEMPDARRAAGKPAEGTIRLSAAHIGSNVVIHVEDDGAGINRDRLLTKAVEKGIVGEGVKLGDEDILDLIFSPGFSTAAAVTDVSGRGVGMDVVRRNILKMGGRIQVTSTEGKGTRFTLIIPLTLAVLDGMIVAVGAERYIVPLTSIIESFRPEPSQIRTLAEGGRIAAVRGDYFRVVGLDKLFGVPDALSDPTKGLVALVETASGTRIGLAVDELIGQQQVVIKSLQENFATIDGISGATILGDGKVALILDIEQICTLRETPDPMPAGPQTTQNQTTQNLAA